MGIKISIFTVAISKDKTLTIFKSYRIRNQVFIKQKKNRKLS